MQPPLGWVVAVMDLLVVRAGQKIKGMLFFLFLRRQNVIAQVSSCLGFTPHLYGKCPRSSLAPLLRGDKGLRLVCAEGGFAGTPLPDLKQRGAKGCSSPSAAGQLRFSGAGAGVRRRGRQAWQPAQEMLVVPPQCWQVERIPVFCFSLSHSGIQRSSSGKASGASSGKRPLMLVRSDASTDAHMQQRHLAGPSGPFPCANPTA